MAPLLRRSSLLALSCAGALLFSAHAAVFQVTYDDTMVLPPGLQGSDLMKNQPWLEFARKLIAGGIAIAEGQVYPKDVTMTDAIVVDDKNAQGLNSHGGIEHGRKKVRFIANVTIYEPVFGKALQKLKKLTIGGVAPWRRLYITTLVAPISVTPRTR
ncbi:unnamed protein product [Polarella glacialis]|uniref:Uncharacterized protein n=1 Tax=Polarella glacialis TaxID=89957 RepID=A0A813FWR6_POLGL|nr:unnamed protein product [Polarella glacialis]